MIYIVSGYIGYKEKAILQSVIGPSSLKVPLKFSILFLDFRILEYLRKAGLGNQVDACLKRKVIWPFPSEHDQTSFGLKEVSQQLELCRLGNFKAWCHQSLAFEKLYKWEIHNDEKLSELSHSEGRKKLKSYLNEETVCNWFLRTYIQEGGVCIQFYNSSLNPAAPGCFIFQ